MKKNQIQLPSPPAAHEKMYPHRHDRAFAYLKFLLLDGGLEPDDIISTEGVAQCLGISRAPVTDAVKRLVRDGFITVIPQVGCRVNAPKPGEVRDFFQLFARSEALITGFAASRRTEIQAKTFQVTSDVIGAQIQELMQNKEFGPPFRALNRQRYAAIHELAGSSITGDIVANMWDRSDYYVRIAFGQFSLSSTIQSVHTTIASAIVAGDVETASSETQSYLAAVGEITCAKLD